MFGKSKYLTVIGILNEFVFFSAGLSCSYLISKSLQNVIDGHKGFSQIYIYCIFCIAICTILIKVINLVYQNSKVENLQKLQENYVDDIIKGKVEVKDSGEIDVRVNEDLQTVNRYLVDFLPKEIASVFMIIICSLLLCSINYLLATVVFLLSILQILPWIIYEKWARKIYQQSVVSDEEYSQWINEGYKGISTIKSYFQENWFLNILKNKNDDLRNCSKKEMNTYTIEEIVTNCIKAFLDYGIYFIYGLFIIRKQIGISDIPLAIVYAQSVFNSLNIIAKSYSVFIKYSESKKRLYPPKKESIGLRVDELNHNHSSKIVFTDVFKKYDDKVVLDNISFEINKGDRVLLLGPNGGGKSTLINVLLGLTDYDKGFISLGFSNIIFVFQKEPVLDITVANLIEYLKSKNRIDSDLFFMHMKNFGEENIDNKKIEECSLGQKKKNLFINCFCFNLRFFDFR